MLRLPQTTAFLIIACLLATGPLGAKSTRSTPHNLAPGRERWGALMVRSSSYHEMLRGSALQGCAAKRLPEAIATPNPMLDAADDLRLTVSFVVGTDGRVSNPLVLDGINADQARPILDAVRLWRFRPAVCNGAPAEFEAKVEFCSTPNRF